MKINKFSRMIVTSICLSMILVTGCRKKSAEEKGREAVDEKAGFIKGVGDSLQGKGREAAQSMGGGVVQVWDGLKEGVEGTALEKITISPELEALGGQVTRVQLTSGGVINAYLIASKPIKQNLRLKALDKDGREIGRAEALVDFAADQAAYVDFRFDERTPMATVVCFEMTLGAMMGKGTEAGSQPDSGANSGSAAASPE